MSKSYRPYDPDQQLLLPAALQQWLPEDYLAYFISDFVDLLSLFYQVLTLRRQAGLAKLGHVALDGTKVRANA